MDFEELQAENERLRQELVSARQGLAGLDASMKAMLYMLEDINRARQELEQSEKMLEEEAGITKHLLMIAEATSHTTSIDKLMEQTVHCTKEITGCDIVLSYLWDRDEKVFKPSHEINLPHNLTPLFRTEPAYEDDVEEMLLLKNRSAGTAKVADFISARDVILSGRPVMINVEPGLSAPFAAFPWLMDTGISMIGLIPLAGRKEALGLLAGIFLRPVEITEKLKKVMEGVRNQVSTALEEARLYRETTDKAIELSNKIETIQSMHEIDRSILSTLDRDEILEIAIRMVMRVIPCDRATVTLVDKDRGGFMQAAGFGAEFIEKNRKFIPFGDTSTTEVIENRAPQYERNLAESANLLPLEKSFLDKGFLSHIRVPLVVREDVVGVLTIGSKRPAAFTPDNLSTLEKIAAQISVALENARLVSDLQELFLGTVKSLSSAIDAKSKWTAGHSERVTSYALGIGQEMGLSQKELKDLELAGLLHDIGKIGTYESILDKPGRLTDEELTVMRQHPARGAEILSPIRLLKDIIPGVKHHHEFYNGTGYPDGLKSEGIPLTARILAVADTYDAMKSDRPYRKGLPEDIIFEEFRKCSGTQFDPLILEAFFRVIS